MQNEFYQTSDLALAAFLKSNGYSITGIEHDGSGKGTFIFGDQPERSGHVLEFFNRQTVVEPLAYLDQLKSLKASRVSSCRPMKRPLGSGPSVVNEAACPKVASSRRPSGETSTSTPAGPTSITNFSSPE